jgi:lipopolysaccharide export system ATP-binding protein
VFDFLFGRNSQRKQQPASGFWRIDLRSLGGPITALARVTLNLPKKAPKPQQRPRRDELRADAAPPRPMPGQQRQERTEVERPQPGRVQLESQPDRADYGRSQYDGPHFDHAQSDRPQRERAHNDPPQSVPRPSVQKASAQQPPFQASERDAILAVQGIEKSFGSRKVVKGVSLYVRRGEAVGLLGPNGAGKTTVFYMITGLIKADRGRVDLDGHNISALPMYQRARLGIGYLPQEASIFRGMTVEDNIRSVLEVVEPNRKRREADLNELLEEFSITRLRKTPSIALSGGERRRVEIARALASRPNYMLLDEPFAGIDPIAVGDIQALVRHLTQRGIGVLITDHNVRETLGLTDRAYIIYSGQVLMEGRTEDIVNDPEVRRVYLGEEFRL